VCLRACVGVVENDLENEAEEDGQQRGVGHASHVTRWSFLGGCKVERATSTEYADE